MQDQLHNYVTTQQKHKYPHGTLHSYLFAKAIFLQNGYKGFSQISTCTHVCQYRLDVVRHLSYIWSQYYKQTDRHFCPIKRGNRQQSRFTMFMNSQRELSFHYEDRNINHVSEASLYQRRNGTISGNNTKSRVVQNNSDDVILFKFH